MNMFRFYVDFSISPTGFIKIGNNFKLLLAKNKFSSLESLNGSISETKYFRISSEKYEEKSEAEKSRNLLENSLLMLGVKWSIGVTIEPSSLPIIPIENFTAISPEIPISTILATKSFKDFEEDLAAIYNSELNITDAKLRLALELYNASQFEISIRAQFLTLVMAMECFIDKEPRDNIAKDIINEITITINKSRLNHNDKNSMVGAIGNLIYKSNTQQLKALANSLLVDKKYNDKLAHEFISYCYSKRSSLVHPKAENEVKNSESDTSLPVLVAELKRFATDVLLEKSKPKQP